MQTMSQTMNLPLSSPTSDEDGVIRISEVLSAFVWFKTLTEVTPFDKLLRRLGGSKVITPAAFIRAAHELQGTSGVTCPICQGYKTIDEPLFGRIYCFCHISEYLNTLADELGPRSIVRDWCTLENLQREIDPVVEVGGRRIVITEKTRESMRNLYDGVHNFINNPMDHPMMVISAGPGVGKSHAVQAIAKYFGKRMAVYHTGQDWNTLVQGALGKKKLNDFLMALQLVPVYIHDDYGAHHATSLTDDNLSQVIANRYNRGYPTILATNEPLNTLSTLDPRIASRLNGSSVIRIAMNAQDLRPVFE